MLVELLATNGNTVVSKSAFLDTGGQLLAVRRRHRDHRGGLGGLLLGRAQAPQPPGGDVGRAGGVHELSSSTYDFTTGADKYAGGASAAVELEPGVWGLIAGDADGDGAILGADAGIYSNQVGQTGYRRADFNLDGTVDGDDLALLDRQPGRQSGAARPGRRWPAALTITPQRKTVLAGRSRSR